MESNYIESNISNRLDDLETDTVLSYVFLIKYPKQVFPGIYAARGRGEGGPL